VATVSVENVEIVEVHRVAIDAKLDAFELTRPAGLDDVTVGAVTHLARADLRPRRGGRCAGGGHH